MDQIIFLRVMMISPDGTSGPDVLGKYIQYTRYAITITLLVLNIEECFRPADAYLKRT